MKRVKNSLSIAMHPHDHERAFLVTESRVVFYTNNQGADWKQFNAPTDPNFMGIDPIKFHSEEPDWIIWHGSEMCSSTSGDAENVDPCHAVAHYSKNGGMTWTHIEDYIMSCAWARDRRFLVDKKTIICHGYRDHTGNQRSGLESGNALQFVIGRNFYEQKSVVFQSGVVGYATFEEYMVIAVVSFSPSPCKFRLNFCRLAKRVLLACMSL